VDLRVRPKIVYAKAIYSSVRGRKVLSEAACEINNCPYQGNPCECEGPKDLDWSCA